MRKATLAVGIAIGAALSGLAPSASADSLSVSGSVRTYELHRPPILAANRTNMPLLIILHGGGGSGARVRQYLGMDALATKHGFAVAYPDGLSGSWNDGRFSGDAMKEKVGGDDVAFLKALAQTLGARGIGSKGDAAIAGISNGGMMVYRLACETSGVFSSYVAMLANMPVDLLTSCKPGQPTPMLILAGTSDQIMPYKGGKIASASGGVVRSADETYSYWGQANRCSGPGNPVPLPDLDRNDTTKVELLSAQRCAPRADTVFLRVVGGGHVLPSRPAVQRGSVDRGTGAANHDLDAAEEIWSFAAGKRR